MNINYDLYKMNRTENVRYYSGTTVVIGLLLILFYNSILFALLLSPMVAFAVKKYYVEYRMNKRKELLKGQFVELLQSLSASISAGRQMGEALEEGLSVLSSSYPLNSPLVQELTYMVNSMKESREGEEPLLRDFAKRAKIRELSSLVEVYSICRETGGDMERAIGKTSHMILEKLSIEKEMKMLSAQKKFEGKLISLMPVMVLIFLRITSSSYIEPLYTTVEGRILVTCSLLGMGYAYYLTDRITRVSL